MHMGVLPHDVNYCVRRTHVTRDLSCLKADRESWVMYVCALVLMRVLLCMPMHMQHHAPHMHD